MKKNIFFVIPARPLGSGLVKIYPQATPLARRLRATASPAMLCHKYQTALDIVFYLLAMCTVEPLIAPDPALATRPAMRHPGI